MRECVAVAALVCIALGCEKGAVTPHGKPDGGDSRTRGDGIGGDVVADLEGDGRAPDQAVLPDRSADAALPDGMAPDGPVPDGPGADLLTDGPVPDDLTSDGAPSDGALPDGALPDGALPDGALPDGALPDGALPDGALPDGVVADGAGSEVTEGCSKVDCGLSCDDPQVCGDCGNGVCDAGEAGAACPFDCCDPSLCLGTPGPEWVDGTPGCAGQVDGTPCSDGKEGNGLETCLSKKCRFENPHCHCAVPEGASPIPDPGPGPEEPAIPMPAEVPAWQGDMPEEPDFEDAWGLFSLDVSAAWQVTEGAPTVLVAIVDSGCADDNPDLDGKIVEQVDLFDSDDVAQDDLGHGTVLASIVAANKDGGGIVGVAPDVSLLCARVSGTDGVASYEALAAGIQWAVDHSASVILVGHAGFGSGEGLAVLEEAIHKAAEADVVLIAPAGSGGGSNLDLFPGAWSPDAIAVAASTDAGLPSQDTDIAPATWLLAPGEMIVGTGPGGELVAENGSSVAAALAAGTAALVRSANPSLTAAEVRGLLRATGNPVPVERFDRLFAARRVSAGAAVKAAAAGAVDVSAVSLRLIPQAPLPGQKAVVRLLVENRGALVAQEGTATVAAKSGGSVGTPGGLLGSEVSLPCGELPAGGSVELLFEFEADGGDFELSGTVSTPADSQAGNDSLVFASATATTAVHAVRVARAELVPPKQGATGIQALAVVENHGNVPEPARFLNATLWPEGKGVDVQIPALAPGERVSVEAVLDGIDAVMENRHQVDLELEPAAGQADLSETFAVLRFTFDSSGTWAQQAYMQLPGENLIADAPWRSILDSIPVLVFYARVTWLQDIKPGWGKKMAWTPILMKNVVIRNPNGPLSGQGNVIYLDWYHIAPLFLPAGATSWDEFGQEVPGGDVVWTLSPDDGAHRVLWIPKAGLVKSCAGLPDPGMCGYYLEVKFNYLKLQVQTWVEGYTRRMLGVEDGSGMLPKFDAADHYFDAHYHTIAEWYRKGELLGPSKAYGGPLWMMTAHLASIGVLDSPKLENVSGKIITTDHNTFFDDLDAPEAGPTSFWEWGNAPAATNSAEMDIYRSIFGQTAGEEVTTDGDTLEPLDTALGRHILTYMSKHVNGSWGWLGAAGWAGGLCTPSYDNLIRRIACNPGQASDCEGDGSGEQCIGGNPDDPQGFIFPAHPLAGGFKWSDSALRHMFSLKSPPWSPLTLDKNNRDYLTAKENAGDKGDFVVRGYQLWNTRVAQEVSSGLFTGTLRDINPYPGAVMDKPGKKWKTWTPHCDGYRASVKEAAVNLLTLARDGANYFFKDDEKPRIWFIRKVFHVAGSDAHGDFGYGTDICATKALGLTTKLGLSGVSDNAMGRPNTYVFGGTLEDLKHGRSTATDGPILELLIDPESRGSYDQETGSITWHDKEDKFEDADGRMGGDGFRDGMRTALVPVLYSEKASQRVIARLRCTNIADLGGGNVKKAELLVSGQGSTSEEPKTILLEGFECNGSYKDYVIPVGYTQEDPTATLSQPVAVMAHVQIGDACPGTYDAYTNPVWLAPMNGVITVQAVKTNANSLYLKMEQELSASFSIDVVFRMTMASQKVQARIMQIDAATGNLIKMTGGEDGEGGLILQGGLDQGWGNSPKGGDPGDTLRNRLSLRIPYNKYIYGPLTAAKLEDERFVLVVSRVPSESDVAPCNDARLCDTFGNPLGIVMLRFKPMSTCQQKSCPSDYKWCKSLCQCAMAYMCPIGSMYFGGCECCMSYDPWWLQCVYCAPKESVFYKFCPNG